MQALSKGPELQTSSDIGEMQSKLANVMNNRPVRLTYLPSRLHLSKTNNYRTELAIGCVTPSLSQDAVRQTYLFDTLR